MTAGTAGTPAEHTPQGRPPPRQATRRPPAEVGTPAAGTPAVSHPRGGHPG